MYLLYAPHEKFGLIPPASPLFTDEVKFYQNVAFCPKFYWKKIHVENGVVIYLPILLHAYKTKEN